MNEELKPCPKCKSTNVQGTYEQGDMDYEFNPCDVAFIICNDCNHSTNRYVWGAVDPIKWALEEWNNRPWT